MSLIHVAHQLTEVLDKTADENLPQELADIVKFHTKGATIASLSSAIPGVGVALAGLASAGFVWTMYARINKMIGIKLSENILKTVASGIVTNLAGYAVGSFVIGTVLSFIPFGQIGTIAVVGAAVYAVTMASGIVYLELLTKIFKAGQNPSNLSADSLKKMSSKVISSMDVDEILEAAKAEFKEKQAEGEFDKEE